MNNEFVPLYFCLHPVAVRLHRHRRSNPSFAQMSMIRLVLIALLTFSQILIYVSGAKASYDPEPYFKTATLSLGNHSPTYFLAGESSEDNPELKSKTRAQVYSIAATTVPLVLARLSARGPRLSEQTGTSILLFATGVILGPSAGSIYADDWELAGRSIKIRTASTAFSASGYFIRQSNISESLGLIMMVSGGLLLAGHALYDILFLSAHSVNYHNARLRLEAGLTYSNSRAREGKHMSSTYPQYINLLPDLGIRLSF